MPVLVAKEERKQFINCPPVTVLLLARGEFTFGFHCPSAGWRLSMVVGLAGQDPCVTDRRLLSEGAGRACP